MIEIEALTEEIKIKDDFDEKIKDMGINSICICGSMRFANEILSIGFLIENKYAIAVFPPFADPLHKVPINENNLNISHRTKIERSDAILVVDINGYIGASMRKEIAYAYNIHKPVIYLSNYI